MIRLNGIEIKPTMFPDGTSQVWKLEPGLLKGISHRIEWDFELEREFIHLAQLKDLIDSLGKYATLEITYLPYGRQDKEISNEATFALYTFARLLNVLKFDRIYCCDPHSEVACDLIDGFVAVYPEREIRAAFAECNANMVCYPDKGALKKYQPLLADLPAIFGQKERDPLTGEIKDYNVSASPADESILIVDDICDGGATFVHLCKHLKRWNAKEINLYVSHGLFTKGIDVLKQAGIHRIFTKEGELK